MTFKTDRITDGKKESIIDYVDSGLGAVAVVAVTEKGRMVLERNRRYVVGNKKVIEIPAGHLEEGEDPAECAAREIEEETGYATKSIRSIGWAYTTPGHSNEVIRLFFARLGKRGKRHLEPNEDIEIFEVPVSDALKMVRSDSIHDMKTIAGIEKAHSLHLM